MATNQTIDGVPLLPCPFCGGEPYATHDHYVHDDLSPMPCVECRSCSAHLKAEDWNRRVEPAAQPQGEPVALSADQLKFLEAIAMNPGAKLNDGIASSEDGNSLWVRLEDLGLIECIGSYKWKLTFNAVELGVKAFLGQQPVPVAVVMPEQLQDPGAIAGLTSRYAQGWNACLDEVTRLNTKE